MKVAKIMTLLKKGDKGDCNNYRSRNFTVKCDRQGLCESSTTKTPKTCRPHLPRISMWFSQWTFNNGYDIFSFRQIQQKCREQITPLHIAFVDLTIPFDMGNREGLCAILQKLGCPPTLTNLVKSLHAFHLMWLAQMGETGREISWTQAFAG